MFITVGIGLDGAYVSVLHICFELHENTKTVDAVTQSTLMDT